MRLKITEQSRAIVGNGTWSSAQQSAQLAASTLVTIVLIRNFDPATFGVYAYATTLAGIGVAFMTAGLSGLAIREFVNDRERPGELVGTLLLVREAFALLGFVALVALSLTSGDDVTVAATALACLVLFGRALDAPELWFASTMQVRRTAALRIGVIATLLGVRLVALWMGAGLWIILGLYLLEPLIGSVLILRRYRRTPEAPGWGRPSLRRARQLVRLSTPLLISGLAAQINLRADIVLIQLILGSSAVGVYAAGARVSELAFFIPVMFMNASLPVMVRLHAEHGGSSSEYRVFVRRMYVRAFWGGVLVAVSVAVAAPPLMRLLFGPSYDLAGDVVRILVIACPFVFMAAVYSKWIITGGALWQSTVRHSAGAVVNIGANLVLLPVVGIIGAAIATVASYVVASFLSCFLTATARPAGIDMARAIAFPATWLVERVRGRGHDDHESSAAPATSTQGDDDQ